MSNQDLDQHILQNNLREITDLLNNLISVEKTKMDTIMSESNIPRQHRYMRLRFIQMMDRLRRIDRLLNSYLALVVHQRPPQSGSRRIQQAYRLYRQVNLWQNYPNIIRQERRRLTALSQRLDELIVQVRHLIFYLGSLSSSH